MQTSLGIVSIIFWALGSSLVMSVVQIPYFELMFLGWFISFSFFATKITVQKRWAAMKQSWAIYCIGTLGIGLSYALTVLSLRMLPPAQAHILTTIWPLMIGASLVLHKTQRVTYMLAAILGFIGVYLFLTQNGNPSTFQKQYILGYAIAILSNLPWVGYVLFSKKHPHLPTDLIGIYCGIAAAVALIPHLLTENWYHPTLYEWMMLLIKGLLSSGLCYVWWDLGIRWGNMALLNVLYYFTPLLGVGFLVLFGWSPREWTFLEGGALILIATMMVGLPYHRFRSSSHS